MNRKLLIFILLAVAILSACAGPNPVPTAALTATAGNFTKSDCPFEKPTGQTVECGYLTVPEDRAAPQGKTIRLAVAIFKSKSTAPAADPIVYLEGGPGGSPLRNVSLTFNIYYAPLLEKRDLILVDQRGTGYSQPALDCPEITQLTLNTLAEQLTPEQEDSQSNQALFACRDRLKSAGVNLAAYTSAANAADLDDLRKALGYSQWNLYGTSYGTRLALTILRDFPQGVRSAILDSVYPLQVNLFNEAPANAARALNLLFETCAADSSCNTAYPALKQSFLDTVKKLNAKPAEVTLTLPDLGIPEKTGKQVKAIISGDDLVNFTFEVLYVSEVLPSLPQILAEAARGNLTPVAQIESQLLGSLKSISRGMHVSVQCYEEVPFGTQAELSAALKAQPELGGAFGTASGPFEMCKGWGLPTAPAVENQAVTSSVPSLVLAGQFDPVTPPSWAKMTAGTLSKSTYFELPFVSHGSSLSVACPRRLVLGFLDNPAAAPDASCIQSDMGKFKFSVPSANIDVELAPFDNTQMNIKGVAPANWLVVSGVAGFYTPSGQATDPTQLLIQSGPLSAEQFLDNVNKSLQQAGITLEKSPQAPRTTSAGLDFTFYQANAGLTQIDLALAHNGKQLFIVLLQSQSGEREALVKAVFMPVVEGLKVK